MARSRKKKAHIPKAPILVLDQARVHLISEAIALFEQPLQRADHSDERVVFAAETIQGLKHKLQMMQEADGRPYLTTFDYNEKIIILQAILLYTFDLIGKPKTPQLEQKRRHCRAISQALQGPRSRGGEGYQE